MKHPIILATAVLAFFAAANHGEVTTTVAHNSNASPALDFKFGNTPQPSRSDAATKAVFSIVEGQRDRNGGTLDKLHDGLIPTNEDQPTENFFFAAGTSGGRLFINLGAPAEIKQVNSYSWHPGSRGPQVYKLYASNGGERLNQKPAIGTDPATCGWRLIADVDTRPPVGTGGGQYAVSISDSDGILGRFQYLLLDVSATEQSDAFGNTFFSEIDVVDTTSEVLPAMPANQIANEAGKELVDADKGKYQITIDTTETPDLTEWAHNELAPVVREWYPKIVEMLSSEGYEAPRRISIVFSASMRGVAATSGTQVRCAASWFRGELQREARGAVVHELVHVVQSYGRARRTNPNPTRTPGWLVEGIADYIRWFLYEPQTRGAEITARNLSRASYDASYRITANFLNWVVQTQDKDIVKKLNAAAREGRYDEALWKEFTGRTVQELSEAWKAHFTDKIAAEGSRTPAPNKPAN